MKSIYECWVSVVGPNPLRSIQPSPTGHLVNTLRSPRHLKWRGEEHRVLLLQATEIKSNLLLDPYALWHGELCTTLPNKYLSLKTQVKGVSFESFALLSRWCVANSHSIRPQHLFQHDAMLRPTETISWYGSSSFAEYWYGHFFPQFNFDLSLWIACMQCKYYCIYSKYI